MAKFFGALLVTACVPGIAWTQSDAAGGGKPGPEPSEAPTELTEIIVTAEKRSTNLQKTPIAVTALSSDALQAAQVRALPDMTALVPNFKMGDVGGFAQITLRGVGISNYLPGAESAVAFNLNEVYVSRPVAQQSGLFDVSDIEVLRGPQGTLYGRNATAGAVNVATVLPTDQLSGFAKINVGNYGLTRTEGAVGGPIVGDKVLIRIAGFRERRDGYGENLATGNDIDDKDSWGVRGTLVIEPTPEFTATVIAEHFSENDRNAGYHYGGTTSGSGIPGSVPVPPFFILLGGVPPSNPYDINNAIDPMFQLRTSAVTGKLEWHAEPFSVKSITGYRNQTSLARTDLSGGSFGGGYFLGGEPAHQFSQELQSRYSIAQFDLTAGLYYFSETDKAFPAAVTYGNDYVNLLLAAPVLPIPGYIYLADVGGRKETSAKAAFTQLSYHLTTKLSLTAGYRYSTETKHLFQQFQFDTTFSKAFNGVAPPPEMAIPPKTFSSGTPRFGIEYQADDRTLLYVSYAKGFKSGGFDSGTAPPLVAAGFQPEKLEDYEGGIKSSLLKNRLRVNLAGFYYNYSNLQVQQVLGCCQNYTANAASAKVYGAEVETSAIIASGFSIDANAAWLHARYGHYFGNDNLLPSIPVIDFSGRRLSNSPDFSGYVGPAYKWPTLSGITTLRIGAEFSTNYYFSPANLAVSSQGGFVKENASLTYNASSGWRATAYVRNISNVAVRVSALATGAVFGNGIGGSLAPPRTYGAEFGYSF